MERDWTDEDIAATLRALKPYAGYRLIAGVAGINHNTIYRVADGEDFKPATRLALVSLFEEVGLESDSDPFSLRDAARKLQDMRPTGSQPSSGDVAEKAKEALRRAANGGGEGKRDKA